MLAIGVEFSTIDADGKSVKWAECGKIVGGK